MKVGGVDVRQIDPHVLMDQIAFVFQNSRLFKASILENVRAARPDATREQVRAALMAAQCGDILEKLPQGMDTLIGSEGTYLSGGEQQRIARTLLKRPKILIFDDSTSAVDTATEGKIRTALAELRDVTKLIIAQRITSVMHTDQIVILEDGRVHAVGTHESLLAGDPIYQEIYASQMKGGEDHGVPATEC